MGAASHIKAPRRHQGACGAAECSEVFTRL